MWILRLALSRPYTFVVMAILIAILGGTAIVTMPVDIFPYIDIPIVSIVWQYSGLSPEEMENRVVTNFERCLTSNVNDIEHIESQSYSSIAVAKIFFHPNVLIDMAVAQGTAQMTRAVRQMPPGMFPGSVLKFDAASVPVLQLGLSSKTLREQDIFDLGNNFIRTPLGTVQGANVSYPFGGKSRSVMVDLNLDELYAKQLSPMDVSNALNLQNLILPTGTAKLAETEYHIRVNSSPLVLDELNNMPIKVVNGAPVYMRDVAQVRDGYQVQTNIVRIDGSLASLLTVLRHGGASTLSVVQGVKDLLPRIQASLPTSLNVTTLFDQSLFVRAAVEGVVREASTAALLTALMILLFLGSWRSTLIVCISIPLSILTSLTVLGLLGQTINVMTLGGLALAVGILVDDATVEIENVHRNMGIGGKTLVRAILDGAQEIAVPAFVSTLCICIVFVPVLMLSGAAKYLFTPLAMGVAFAMLTSYLLTRTVVPTMVHYLLQSEMDLYQEGEGADTSASKSAGAIWRVHQAFDRKFEKFRDSYHRLLEQVLAHRVIVGGAFLAFALASVGLIAIIGQNFFPYVDAGQRALHFLTPTATRIEEAAATFASIESEIRRVIPAQ